MCVCVGGGGGGGGKRTGEDSYIKRAGVLIGNFGKKRYQDPALWAWLEFFSPLALRGTNRPL